MLFGIYAREPRDTWNEPDFAGWAALLRRVVPRIVTCRFPDFELAETYCFVTNDRIVVEPKTRQVWDYFRAAGRIPNNGLPVPGLGVKIFFGRTIHGYSDKIHVFSPEVTAGMTWALFLAQIDDFIDIPGDDHVRLNNLPMYALRKHLREKFPDGDRPTLFD